jgi:hypothetical protein
LGSAEVFLSGTLEPFRTAFFSLLRPIVGPWRRTLLRAVAAADQHSAAPGVRRHARQTAGVPVEALVGVLRDYLVQQVEYGAVIHTRHSRLFPDTRGPVRVADTSTGEEAWDTDQFLLAAAQEVGIGQDLEELGGLLATLPDAEGWADLTRQNEALEEMLS